MGRVTDSSAAAVPGVAVTLTNVDTGSVRAVTTNSTGDWEARFLTPGTYRITFELTGFKTLRREGITVSTAEMATVDVDARARRAGRGCRSGRERGNGVFRLDDDAADVGSEGARGPADVGAQLHSASRHRAGRVGRHQRAAVERQRVDLTERERRPHDQQQLRLQRHGRHQPALLQQPGQRVRRHDRQRRRLVVPQRRASP